MLINHTSLVGTLEQPIAISDLNGEVTAELDLAFANRYENPERQLVVSDQTTTVTCRATGRIAEILRDYPIEVGTLLQVHGRLTANTTHPRMYLTACPSELPEGDRVGCNEVIFAGYVSGDPMQSESQSGLFVRLSAYVKGYRNTPLVSVIANNGVAKGIVNGGLGTGQLVTVLGSPQVNHYRDKGIETRRLEVRARAVGFSPVSSADDVGEAA